MHLFSLATDWIDPGQLFSPEGVTAVAAGVTAFGVGLLFWQALILKRQLVAANDQLAAANGQLQIANKQLEVAHKQLEAGNSQVKADHERSRRDKAVDLILDWTSGLKQTSSLVRIFVEKLDATQCEKLSIQSSFDVSIEQKDIILGCLTGILNEHELDQKISGHHIKLSEKESAHIFYLAIGYLNRLECVLTAWDYGIADKLMIEQQFRNLIWVQKDKIEVLSKFRTACEPKQLFPSLKAFLKVCQDLDKAADDASRPSKPPIYQ